jgi:poly(A) polymerase
MTACEAATEVISVLQAHGHEASAIGGCVRDLLLGREPKDYDVVTNARPDVVEALFVHTKAVGKQFGIIIVGIEDQQIEVATYRSDGIYSDGRRPDKVTFAKTLREDICRRDFTINGLVSDLQMSPYQTTHDYGIGLVRDPLGEGQFIKDLNDKVIRAIGDPEQRFAEDKLRMLRAVRFAVQLGFTIEPETYKAIKKHAAEIESVSRERVRDELFKILMSPEPARGIFLMNQTGLLASLLLPIHEGEFGRMLTILDAAVDAKLRTPEFMLAVLLLWCDTEETECNDTSNRSTVIESLKLSTKQVEFLKRIDRWYELLWLPTGQVPEIKRFLREPFIEEMIELHSLVVTDLSTHTQEQWQVSREKIEAILKEDLWPAKVVDGNDLLEIGLKGTQVGAALTYIEDLQLNGANLTRQQALDAAMPFKNVNGFEQYKDIPF